MDLYIKKIEVDILSELIEIEKQSVLPIPSIYGWTKWECDTRDINEKFFSACHKEFVEFMYDTKYINIHQTVHKSINSIAKRIKPNQRSAQLVIPFYETIEEQRGFYRCGEIVAELVIDVDFV